MDQQETLAILFKDGKAPVMYYPSLSAALCSEHVQSRYSTFIFDVDRVLIPFDSTQPYHEVLNLFHPAIVKRWLDNKNIALATNKGNVPWWERTKNPKYDSLEISQEKLSHLVERLGIDQSNVFACYGIYLDRSWTIPERLKLGDPGTDPNDRKPAPGMLIKAMAKFGVTPKETLMIGDALTDVEAARRAGCNALLVKMEKY